MVVRSWKRGAVGGVLLITTVLAVWSNAARADTASPSVGAFAPEQLASRAGTPMTLYPHGLTFDVLRDGSVVGQHRTTFRRDGDALTVSARMDLTVKLLGLTLYGFAYQSTAEWRDGALRSLTAVTDDDGTVTRVTAQEEGGEMRVEGPNGAAGTEAPLFPTNHWHAGVLTRDQVLNTITGRIATVTITPGPVEWVSTGSGPRSARRFDYGGAIQVSSWYDAAGRWVKLRFKRGGSTIEYRCRVCGDEHGPADHGAASSNPPTVAARGTNGGAAWAM